MYLFLRQYFSKKAYCVAEMSNLDVLTNIASHLLTFFPILFGTSVNLSPFLCLLPTPKQLVLRVLRNPGHGLFLETFLYMLKQQH